MEAGKKQDYAKIVFIDPDRRRRLRIAMIALLILVCLVVAGYTRLKPLQEGMMAAAVTPATTGDPPGVPAAEGSDQPVGRDEVFTSSGGLKAALAAPVPEETCGNARVLVDRAHTLPPDYVPGDLVSLPGNGVPTLGGREMFLRREATEHLRGLVSAAAADGEELVVSSAFRSYEDQQISHARLKSIYGAGADTMSATPGHSQHQLGTAVDFTNAAVGYQIHVSFGYTTAALWLREHATGYGFVLAYPPGGDETGFAWEPWHYRYIGVENAEELEKSGLSLQEYLAREGILPSC